MSAWPLDLRGVTETVVTTPAGDGTHRVAAMGIHAGDPVWARTYGGSQTHANLRACGECVVHFTRDPALVVEAALGEQWVADPHLGAPARVEIEAREIDRGEAGETPWTEWALDPVDATVERRTVPRIERAVGAVVEAAVAASRLGVPDTDRDRLLERITDAESVVDSCGDQRARAAMRRLHQLRADPAAE
ncbi:DUF447 domain-containing protein [Halococcoides cellulosivorans]|uniref:DUF447 domain-containing protein n=1 Tax=Halococcoides cellulosivorans TaxID=1679096 RepID=A0A2R4X142_9EURY|nr:DUF447 domain-containing protein [Halococcoides cellulosivorans]AWB27453.1 DUF447 domain-containing protein [Halococcoides cellulosivorans]